MKFRTKLSFLVAIVAALQASQAFAQIVQAPTDLLDGQPYLWVEAERASTINAPADGNTWRIAFKGGPDMSVVNVGSGGTSFPIVPETSNVSGAAIWAPVNDFSIAHSRTAIYDLQFITAGTYQFFLRQSLYDGNNNGSFLNEDSIYLPPAFNKNSGLDWVGHAGEQFDEDDVTVDIPIPGFSLDPDGWKPELGDHERDGLLELANWGIKSEGTVVLHTPAGTLSSNGNFNWYNRPAYQGTNQPGNTFAGFFGQRNQFVVTEEMVGETVTFELGLREHNVAIDGFMFIQTGDIYPDMDILDIYSQEELDAAILPDPVDPLDPDYNGDSTTDAADYVMWRKGLSPDDSPFGYAIWNNSFGEPGGGGGSAGVPEPASVGLLVIGLAALTVARRRGNR